MVCHTGGSGQDTQGTPVPTSVRRPCVARPHAQLHETQGFVRRSAETSESNAVDPICILPQFFFNVIILPAIARERDVRD